MSLARKLLIRFRALFQKRKLDAEMDEEMRSHIEMRTQANIETGMNPKDARYAALRHFGVYEKVSDRFVLGENVSQAAQFVESGNAQIGSKMTSGRFR